MVIPKQQNYFVTGFTLIEILLVVLIIAIMSYLGANAINSQSAERQIMNEAGLLEAEIKYICDLAVLENRAHGLEFSTTGVEVLQHNAGVWLSKGTQNQPPQPHFKFRVLLSGKQQKLADEPEQMPHVICQSDGSLTPFELRWYVTENTTNESIYFMLKTESPWLLDGAWIET